MAVTGDNCSAGFESWSHQLWNSLHGHPVLETFEFRAFGQEIPQEEKPKWTQSILDMVKTNTILKKLELDQHIVDQEMVQDEVEPRLEMNAFRPRVAAVAQEADIELRLRLLGKALEKVEDNSTLVFMFLSENAVVMNPDLLSRGTQNRGQRLLLVVLCALGLTHIYIVGTIVKRLCWRIVHPLWERKCL